MKKFYSLIAMAAFALAANAEVTDVSTISNGIYVQETEVAAGATEVKIPIILKSNVAIETIGFNFTLPEGVKVGNHDELVWDDEADDEVLKSLPNLYLTDGGATTAAKHGFSSSIDGQNVKVGILKLNAQGTIGKKLAGAELCYIVADIDASASGDKEITIENIEFSKASYLSTDEVDNGAPGVNGKYNINPVTTLIKITGADAIDNVAADGTQAASAAKKVVDGKLVIETAKGSFNAAGAQVK